MARELRAFADDLRTRFAAKSIAAVVVEGRERVDRQFDGVGRVVLYRPDNADGYGDTKQGPAPGPHVSPVARVLFARWIGLELRITARSNRPGAKPEDHYEACEALLDQVLVATHLWAQASSTLVVRKGGGFIAPADDTTVETQATYLLQISIGHGVSDTPWTTYDDIAPAGELHLNGGTEDGCSHPAP